MAITGNFGKNLAILAIFGAAIKAVGLNNGLEVGETPQPTLPAPVIFTLEPTEGLSITDVAYPKKSDILSSPLLSPTPAIFNSLTPE